MQMSLREPTESFSRGLGPVEEKIIGSALWSKADGDKAARRILKRRGIPIPFPAKQRMLLMCGVAGRALLGVALIAQEK